MVAREILGQFNWRFFHTLKKIAILPLVIYTGSSLAVTGGDLDLSILIGNWIVPSFPILIGLSFHLLTLSVVAIFIHDCIRKGSFKHVSGLPLIGPIFIDFGLKLAPYQIPAWAYLLPWLIELLAVVASWIVERVTHAKPDPSHPTARAKQGSAGAAKH